MCCVCLCVCVCVSHLFFHSSSLAAGIFFITSENHHVSYFTRRFKPARPILISKVQTCKKLKTLTQQFS